MFREPIVQFVLIAGILFFLYSLFPPSPAVADQTIVIDQDRVDWVRARFKNNLQRDPDAGELDWLLKQYVENEIFYREAIALGLEEGDPVIRQRVITKMKFLVEDSVPLEEPDEQVLRSFYANEKEQFERPARMSLRQILLETEQQALAARDAIAAGASVEEVSKLGAPSLLPASVNMQKKADISAIFGTGFADAVDVLKVSEQPTWAGPVASAFGMHMVMLEARKGAVIPDFEEVAEEVKKAWWDLEKKKNDQRVIQRIKDQYEIAYRNTDIRLAE